MKAMVIESFGESQHFRLVELPQPSITGNEVLVKIEATSINPVDIKIRQGGPYAAIAPAFPAILHSDVAGTVVEVGKYVEKFKVGDAVYGCVGGFKGTKGGALAEFIAADPDLLAHKPKNLSMEEAAAVPLVGITAWQTLINTVDIHMGQTVLVHAGTGGVGHIAIQIAKACGAIVYSTCSSMDKMEIAKGLGADYVINYKEQSVAEYVQAYTAGAGFDVVFDTVGGKTLEDSTEAAGLYGKVTSVMAAGEFNLTNAFLKGQTLHTIYMPLPLITGKGRAAYGELLAKLARLIEAGKVKPLLDKQRFSLREISGAHDYFAAGRAVGKVVVTI